MSQYIERIQLVRPGAQVAIFGDDLYENIDWGNETPIPDVELLAADVAIAKVAKLRQLEQARDAAERADVAVAGKVYSASESFQAKVSRTINQTGRGKPVAGANNAWRTADAKPIVMNAALLGLIEDAISAQGAAAWARFWLRFDAVQAATTNAEVDAVVW